jgi:ElaB/YqjD/DUF883 family membrane-anchored ribosome-binding protein
VTRSPARNLAFVVGICARHSNRPRIVGLPVGIAQILVCCSPYSRRQPCIRPHQAPLRAAAGRFFNQLQRSIVMNSPISTVAGKAEALVDSTTQTADEAITSTQRAANEKLGQLADSVEEVRTQAGPAIGRLANEADELRRRSVEVIRGASSQVREGALRATDKSVAFIRDEPVKSVLIAAMVGALSMALINLIGRAGTARE